MSTTSGNGNTPSPESLSFHNSRITQQSTSGLRKLTAIELLGRTPVPVSIPEFDGAVFYFSHPSARTVISFYQARDRMLKEIEEAKKANDEMRGISGEGDGGAETTTLEILSKIDSIATEVHDLTCGILAETLVSESGEPIFTGEEIAQKMSRENFVILSGEMFKFLTRGLSLSKSQVENDKADDDEKSDDDIKADLIVLEDELDLDSNSKSKSSPSEENEPKNA